MAENFSFKDVRDWTCFNISFVFCKDTFTVHPKPAISCTRKTLYLEVSPV